MLKLYQLLDKIYDCGPAIYYMSYPVKVYYIGNPKDEPADYAEKVLGTLSLHALEGLAVVQQL